MIYQDVRITRNSTVLVKSITECCESQLGLVHAMKRKKDMWQSQVEIEYYFVADFDCITPFKVLYRETSVKVGAHTPG